MYSEKRNFYKFKDIMSHLFGMNHDKIVGKKAVY